MSLPWGVKEEVNPDNAKDVGDYLSKVVETTFALPSNNEIQILKADVKERKGKYVLIARYQILKQA